MSHNWNCPDPWEARREARHDAEYSGWNHHRYREDCPEANEAYEREYRNEEYRIEERAEEARAEARRAERNRESYAQEQMAEAAYYTEQERQYYEQREADYYEALMWQEPNDVAPPTATALAIRANQEWAP